MTYSMEAYDEETVLFYQPLWVLPVYTADSTGNCSNYTMKFLANN